MHIISSTAFVKSKLTSYLFLFEQLFSQVIVLLFRMLCVGTPHSPTIVTEKHFTTGLVFWNL